MNKYFVILSVIILAGISMAGMDPDPRLDAKLTRTLCSLQPIPALVENQSAFNATYNDQMTAAIGDIMTSFGMLLGNCSTRDIAAFNAIYSTLPQKQALVASIYFRAGFTAVNRGAVSWPFVMSQYMTSMSLVQPCLQTPRFSNCELVQQN